MITIVLLIIAAEMLDGHAATVDRLNTSGDSCRHLAGNYGIFRIILKVPATKRISVKIQSGPAKRSRRSQHFSANRLSDFFKQFYVPSLRLQKFPQGKAVI